MRDAVKGVLAGILVLALGGAIAARIGLVELAVPRPHGTGAWMLSRTTGLVAYLALGLEMVAGLLVSTRRDLGLSRGRLVDLHGWLSPLALVLVLAHAIVLLADRHADFDVIDLLVPFASSRWRIGIGLGVLAAYLGLVVHASFGLRKRLGAHVWRKLHYLTFPAFALATVHALAAGTDRGHPWFVAVYAVLLGIVILLLVARVRRAR